MSINRHQLRLSCATAFGKEAATEELASQMEAKLQTLGIRLGQVITSAPAGKKDEVRTVSFRAQIHNGPDVSVRTIRIAQDMQVLMDSTGSPTSELGFKQHLSSVEKPGTWQDPRKQTGDYRE